MLLYFTMIAYCIGLVQRVVPRARLREEAEGVASTLAAMPPDAIAGAKEAMRLGAD